MIHFCKMESITKRERGMLRGFLMHVMALLTFIMPIGLSQHQPVVIEPELKAVFIFNFLKFVHWPEEDSAANYRILVWGDTEIFESLKEISEKKTINGKPMQVKEIHSLEEFQMCNILFVSDKKLHDFEKIEPAIRDQPILTVSDDTESSGLGVGLLLYQLDGRIRFEVDTAVFKANGLQVSSQLLKLAKKREDADQE